LESPILCPVVRRSSLELYHSRCRQVENMRSTDPIRPIRPPLCFNMPLCLSSSLEKPSTIDARNWAVVTTCFWGQIRLVGFLPSREKNYPLGPKFLLRISWVLDLFTSPAQSLVVNVAMTFSSPDRFLPAIPFLAYDPIDALHNHFVINKASSNDPSRLPGLQFRLTSG